MDWRERVKRHEESGSLNSLRAEDIVSRRVLNGLGLTQRSLFRSEMDHGKKIDTEDTLWSRVKGLMDAMSSGMTGETGRILFEIREVSPSEKFIESNVDAVSMMLGEKDAVIMLCLIKGTKNTVAYVFIRSEELTPDWIMRPVSTLLYDTGKCRVWARQIPDLVKDMSECMSWQ